MNPIFTRLVVYPKDVCLITGRRNRAARKLLERIRHANGKHRGDFVSVEEFCRYTGLKEDLVKQVLK